MSGHFDKAFSDHGGARGGRGNTLKSHQEDLKCVRALQTARGGVLYKSLDTDEIWRTAALDRGRNERYILYISVL